MTGYNGWKNWETWNVALWIDNEEPLYRARVRANPITADRAEAFVRDVLPDGTPDMKDDFDDYAAVDWDEIAANWKDE